MSNRTENNSSPAAHPPRRRLWIAVFFVVWTILTALSARWLLAGFDAGSGAAWVLDGGALSKASFAERIGAWFKLADLNFHGIYPWILLAPYVAWLGVRFHLERGRWRVSLPAHLAGCALFAIVCHTLTARGGWGRQVIVSVRSEMTAPADGKRKAGEPTLRTNEFKMVTAGPLPPLSTLPPAMGGLLDETLRSGRGSGQAGGGSAWAGPGDSGRHDSFYWMQRVSRSLPNVLNVLAYASLVAIAQAVYFHRRRSRERERRAVALEAQLTQARLHALQAQLHPHFLFNALNAISTLLRRDTRAAQDALASFSDLLRLALNQSTQPEVLLCEDLEFLRRYVEIQQTRLGERLRVEEVIAPETLECYVPVLLLQPLVENAIRHGIEPSPGPGVVRVCVQPQGQRLLLTVEDNGAGLSPRKRDQCGAGIGIGLENLRARLESLYGTQQRVELGPGAAGGVTVRVEIPLRQMRAVEPAAPSLAGRPAGGGDPACAENRPVTP